MKLVRDKYFILVVLSLLYLAVRVGITLCSERLIFQGEEPFVGIVARGIVEGWAKPLLDFQVCPHLGGSIINAIFVPAPFSPFDGDGVGGVGSPHGIRYWTHSA